MLRQAKMVRLNRRQAVGVLAALAVGALTACGSGSSSGGSGGGDGTRRITGTVTDGSGNPVAGATVTAEGITTTTNNLGQYTLAGLPSSGNVVVQVSASGFQTFSTTVTSSGQTTLNVDLVSTSGGVGTRVLSGRVTSSTTGLGIASATVSAGGRTTNSTADGNYQLTGLPSGVALNVTFSASGFTTATITVTDTAQATLNATLTPSGGGGVDVNQPPPPPVFD